MIVTLRSAGVDEISVAGSVRRYRETIGDIDLSSLRRTRHRS